MTADTLAQSSRYASLAPRFAAAFAFLRKLPTDQPVGRHDREGLHQNETWESLPHDQVPSR